MKLNVAHNFKLRLQAGEIVFGATLGPGNDPGKTVKALKDFGFDFFMIENEHSLVGKDTILEYIRVSREFEMVMWLRPEENFANCRCYLDSGVHGLMLPQVDTLAEVVYAVNQAYLPPIGHRGFSVASPYLIDFQNPANMPFLSLIEYINNNTMVFPQTESLENIKNLPQILRLEGVTGTMLGPNDLAVDIGGIDPKALRSELLTTDFMEEKYREIAKICKDTGKAAGIGALSPKDYGRLAKEGYQLFFMGYVRDGQVDSVRPRIEETKSLIG